MLKPFSDRFGGTIAPTDVRKGGAETSLHRTSAAAGTAHHHSGLLVRSLKYGTRTSQPGQSATDVSNSWIQLAAATLQHPGALVQIVVRAGASGHDDGICGTEPAANARAISTVM